MATIKDIAKHAGVSVTTVSRAFNNRGYISQETRDKINLACKELNYTPNEIARTLFRKKSNIIGVMIPKLDHYFFSEFIQIIEDSLYKAGYKMMVCATNGDSEKEKSYFNMFQANKVDGVIIASYLSHGHFDYEALDIPLVAFDRFLSDKIPCIGSDHYELGRLATQTLIEHGCKNLVHISGDTAILSPAHEKTVAFKTLCNAAQVKHKVFEKEMTSIKANIEDGIDYQSLFDSILNQFPNLDGIFLSDVDACHFIQYAYKHNISVPEDVQIVGYDNLKIACLATPNITTVAQDLIKISDSLVNVLRQLIDQSNIRSERTQIKHPVKIVYRESTK